MSLEPLLRLIRNLIDAIKTVLAGIGLFLLSDNLGVLKALRALITGVAQSGVMQ